MNKQKKILMIGTMPPPLSGQTLSFEMLLDKLKYYYEVKHINISPQIDLNSFFYNFFRVFNFLYYFYYLVFLCIRNNFYCSYITISQSKKGFFRDFFFISILSFFKIKIIVHLKGGNYDNFFFTQNFFIKKLIVYSLLKTKKIIVLGKSIEHIFHFDEKLKDKIEIIYNCLTFDLPPKIIKKDLISKKKINILFLSNLIESKGYYDILEALNMLKKENIEFDASFCGSFILSSDDTQKYKVSDLKKKFFKKIKDYNLDKNVKYISNLNFKDKIHELLISDIFILPTNYIYEGQPVSIIEALAFRNIVISTKYRSIPDMIDENIEGFFVDYGNPKQIFNKILWIYKNKKLGKQMQDSAYKRYLKQFTIEVHIKKFRNLIDNI